jgi:hypothetical protein
MSLPGLSTVLALVVGIPTTHAPQSTCIPDPAPPPVARIANVRWEHDHVRITVRFAYGGEESPALLFAIGRRGDFLQSSILTLRGDSQGERNGTERDEYMAVFPQLLTPHTACIYPIRCADAASHRTSLATFRIRSQSPS